MEIDPNDAESQVALGVASRGDGKFDEARKAYERALDIEPDYPPALYDLGVLYMDFDKVPAKAKELLTQYLQAAGKDDGGAPTSRAGSRSPVSSRVGATSELTEARPRPAAALALALPATGAQRPSRPSDTRPPTSRRPLRPGTQRRRHPRRTWTASSVE